MQYLKVKTIYRPLIFIFAVVIAPGTTDAMFYYESNVLLYSATTFGYLSVVGSCASIIGVWLYKFAFAKSNLKVYFTVTTILLAAF